MTISYLYEGVENKVIFKKVVSKGWCKESRDITLDIGINTEAVLNINLFFYFYTSCTNYMFQRYIAFMC